MKQTTSYTTLFVRKVEGVNTSSCTKFSYLKIKFHVDVEIDDSDTTKQDTLSELNQEFLQLVA